MIIFTATLCLIITVVAHLRALQPAAAASTRQAATSSYPVIS